jgi:hypothetical protein
VDRLTAILGEQHDDVQRILETTGPGVVSYHRVSRWGEWFTIRAPLISAGETTLTAERGARLPPRQERGDTLRNRDTDGGDGSGRDADARASGADDGSDDGSDLSGFLSAPARGAR